MSDSNSRKLSFLSQFHIFAPPSNVPADEIITLYNLDEQYKETAKVAGMLQETKITNITSTHKRLLHCETIGLLLSMVAMATLRFIHNHYHSSPVSACGIPASSTTNNTTTNTTNACKEISLPACLPYSDSTFVSILALLALLFNLFFAGLLAWHNFSFTILRRQLKNAHVFFILFLVLFICYIELHFTMTPLHQQLVMTVGYLTSTSTFLLLDAFKHMPRYGLVLITCIVLCCEATEIIRQTVLLCCEAPYEYAVSNWLKTLHFNVIVVVAPIAFAVVKDVHRKDLFFVIVHPLRLQRDGSYNNNRASNTWKKTDGGDIEMQQTHQHNNQHNNQQLTSNASAVSNTSRLSLEKGKTLNLTNEYPKTMETYNVEAGIRLLTLVGLPSPTIESKWLEEEIDVNDILNGKDSHPENEQYMNDELRRRVWGILKAYGLESKLWDKTYASALLPERRLHSKDVEQFNKSTKTSISSSTTSSTDTFRWFLVFVLLMMFVTQLGISFSPTNWVPSETDACGRQLGIKVAAEWYAITLSCLAFVGLVAYVLLIRSNFSKRNCVQLLQTPTVIMFLFSLVGLLLLDIFVPETTVSGLNSLIYVTGLVMFVFTDVHIWRSRVLAGCLGSSLFIVTIANTYWDTKCHLNSTFELIPAMSLSKCDVRRSLYLSVVICLADGLLTMFFDGRNERLWFVTVHGDRETGDGDGTTSEVKMKYLNSRFISMKNVLTKRTKRRKTEFIANQQNKWGVAFEVPGKKNEDEFTTVRSLG